MTVFYALPPEKRVFSANRPPDMTRGIHHFYIYCSLVRSVAINEKNLPLLATVDATRGNYAEQMVHPIHFLCLSIAKAVQRK